MNRKKIGLTLSTVALIGTIVFNFEAIAITESVAPNPAVEGSCYMSGKYYRPGDIAEGPAGNLVCKNDSHSFQMQLWVQAET